MPSVIVTATFQSTLLAIASNITAQFLSHHLSPTGAPFVFSLLDLLRFALLNILVAPPNFLWQGWLERHFPTYPGSRSSWLAAAEQGEVMPGEKEMHKRDDEILPVDADGRAAFSWPNALKKWVLDCFTLGALGNTLAFLVVMGGLKGKDPGLIWAAVQKDTMPIILAGYKVWPLASIFSFVYVPWEKRLVFLSFVGFLWGIYMSLVAARQ